MKKVFFLISIFFFISCSKKDTELRLADMQIPVLQGFEYRDFFGKTIGTEGIPDIKLGNNSNSFETSDLFFVASPNPSDGIFHIYIKSDDYENIKIWIVEALYENGISLNSNYINSELFIAGGFPILSCDSIKSHSISFDLTDFENQYYRIYLLKDSVLLWDNIVISK